MTELDYVNYVNPAFRDLCLVPSGEFSGEEGGRAGEWNSDKQWSQVQAEAGQHTTGTQVQSQSWG